MKVTAQHRTEWRLSGCTCIDSCLLCKLVVHREASRVSRSRPYRSLDPFRGIDCSRVFLPITRKERNSRRYPRHGCVFHRFPIGLASSRKLENVVWKRGNNWKWVRESNSSPSSKKDNANFMIYK